jgi:hypothetical protein
LVVLVLAVPSGCGGAISQPDACSRAGFSAGSTVGDGLFFAVAPRACARRGETSCEVGDGTGAIDREVVAKGIEQDWVAVTQFVGVGFNTIPGYVTGECFGVAVVRVRGGPGRTDRRTPHACDPKRAAPPIVLPADDDRPAIRARTPDPWRRAPNTGGVGKRKRFVPPWALLTWTGRDGSHCYEPGQYVDADTPGRSDQLPGVAPVGKLRRARMVGPLRYDSKSGPGIQLYNVGRFNPYPREEGGSCGDPSGPAGLIFSWETEIARLDLNLGVTTVAGIAGPRVRSVSVAGRTLRLEGGAFLAVVRGEVAPARLPVTVGYDDGTRRTFSVTEPAASRAR